MQDNVIDLSSRRNNNPDGKVYLSIAGDPVQTGTHPFLGVASDGNKYWCKRVNSNHGRESAINEVAVSVIGKMIGAQVRDWKIIYIPPSLKNSLVGVGELRYRLDGLPLFGSLLLPAGQLITNPQNIPFVSSDGNYNHIPKIIALWHLCCAGEDIQLLHDTNNDNALWSIDHGFWFDSFPYPWEFPKPRNGHGIGNIPLLRDRIPKTAWDKAIESLDQLDDSLPYRFLRQFLKNGKFPNRKQTTWHTMYFQAKTWWPTY